MSRQPTITRPGRADGVPRIVVPQAVAGASPELLALLKQFAEATNAASLSINRQALSQADATSALAGAGSSAKVYTTNTTAVAGQFLRISPPDSRGVALLLPPPGSTQPGDTVSVSLENPLGSLRVSCVPNQAGAASRGARVTSGAVNGSDRATFTTAGLIVFTSNGATGWTTAAEHPAESAATPGINPISSPEITPENTSGSSWRWLLRPFSIVLGRLAKVSGLTVLGNAAASLGAVGEVTASGARQALLSNSAGTGIGWRALEAADLPASSPYGWDDALATDAHSGAHTPIVDSGQALNFASGATGITADGTLSIAATGPLSASGASVTLLMGSSQKFNADTLLTKTLGPQVRTEATATGANAAITWLTGGVSRLTVNGNGEWSTPAGAANQYWKWQSGAFPVWSSLALSDLPSQAADTFLGRLAGSGTPTAQLLSDIDSASVIYDATSHTFQLAAGTGDVTWSQNSTATTIANDAVSNAKLRNSGALSVIGRSANSSGDPADIGAMAASGAVLRESGNTIGFGQVATAGLSNNAVDDTKLRQGGACSVIGRSANSTGNVADISATLNDRLLTRVSNVVAFSQLNNNMIPGTTITKDKLIQSGDQTVLGNGSGASASPADLALIEPLIATATSLTIQASARMGMIKEDVDALGSSSLGYRKSRKTSWFFDEFELVPNSSVSTAGTFLTTGCGSWVAVAGGAAGSTAFVTGESNHPGILRIATGATSGNTVQINKGNNATDKWIIGTNIERCEVIGRANSTASMGFFIGFTDNVNNQIAFNFDTATDTTIHAICTAAGVTTDVDTNLAPGTGWNVYEIRQTTVGTVEFYIDDVLKATISTNVPSTAAMNNWIWCITRTNASKNYDIDYVYVQTRDIGTRTS